MEQTKTAFWFPAKKSGIGWGLPVTWQGWSILSLYTLLVLAGITAIPQYPAFLPFLTAVIFLLSGLFIYICWKKGEKIDFQWSKKKA